MCSDRPTVGAQNLFVEGVDVESASLNVCEVPHQEMPAIRVQGSGARGQGSGSRGRGVSGLDARKLASSRFELN